MKKTSRKMRKPLLVVCCMLVLIAVSVSATLAYFTDSATAVNTFTVGKVDLSLDETETDENGVAVDPDKKTQSNKYHLVPGKSYMKDPTVHVDADSQDSWIYVKVENGIADIEAADTDTTKTIATQIAANGWKPLEGVDNVYYMAYAKGQTDKDLEVFASFTLKGKGLVNGTAGEGEVSIDGFASATVKITAYAVQMGGFDSDEKTDVQNAKAAWEAGQAQGWTVNN